MAKTYPAFSLDNGTARQTIAWTPSTGSAGTNDGPHPSSGISGALHVSASLNVRIARTGIGTFKVDVTAPGCKVRAADPWVRLSGTVEGTGSDSLPSTRAFAYATVDGNYNGDSSEVKTFYYHVRTSLGSSSYTNGVTYAVKSPASAYPLLSDTLGPPGRCVDVSGTVHDRCGVDLIFTKLGD